MPKDNCFDMDKDNSLLSATGNNGALPVERHPWAPFMPDNARLLIMGTFPPKPNRWRMYFYYPNPTNDFWRIMGIIFYGDPLALYDSDKKEFDLAEIKVLLRREGIAMSDTGHKVRRLRDNASDKFLEIVEPVDLDGLLRSMPGCHVVVTTGEKAAAVIANLTGTGIPRTGEYVDTVYEPLGRELRIWRMPSTSRAYPLPVQQKAAFYSRMFETTPDAR